MMSLYDHKNIVPFANECAISNKYFLIFGKFFNLLLLSTPTNHQLRFSNIITALFTSISNELFKQPDYVV